MEDEQNGSYQHGRQPKLSKSLKQRLQCGKKNSEDGSGVSKEQTKPKYSAEIRLKAEIRFRFGRNRNPFSQFRFRSCRNRNLIMNFGFNRIFRPKLSKENQETKELLKMRGKHK